MPNIKKISNQISEIAQILKSPSDGLTWFSPWSATQIQEELSISQSWGYFEGEGLVAFLFARPTGGEDSNEFEITNLGTHVDHRRRGIMRRLLHRLFQNLPNASVWLEVHEGNQPAIKLYASLGFVEIGRRRHYYSDGAAAILMKRSA